MLDEYKCCNSKNGLYNELESLEDKLDYEIAVKAWKEFEKTDRKTYTLEEVKKELQL